MAAQDLRETIERYDRPGPRYTSYPTAPTWSEGFGEGELRAALRRSQARELSVYVHVPFCERLCAFCACNRTITQDHAVAGPYLEGLEREASLIARELPEGVAAVQLALGGGSPNFLRSSELERLCRIVDRHFPPRPDAERSAELDPRRTTTEQLEALVGGGFNRFSFGVQDLDPRVQRAIHREQTPMQVRRLVDTARKLGVQSVGFDLIYGLPYQTVARFDRTLEQVVELGPDRIALYSYAHVTWISKAQRPFERKDLPTASQKIEIFLRALERLEAAGYRSLGLDHFALPHDPLARAADGGDLHRNFMGYTTRSGVDLVALGPSGISELSDAFGQSERDPETWRATVAQGRLATCRGWRLGEDDLRRRWLIQRVMCTGEIPTRSYRARFEEPLEERVPDLRSRLAPLVADGLLTPETPEGWRVTPTGRLLLRVVAMAFDAYLTPPDPDQPRYSRTV
ncbi:MAG: oxygen-independent coproporphyrinogen III oxidase [Myxococcota bacterium]